MTLIYPVDKNFGRMPIIIARIECLLAKKVFFVPMLLDTGACETWFPANLAAFFGHNNLHPHVKNGDCNGVGGKSKKYFHSVQTSLLDPQKTAHANPVIAWTDKTKSVSFIEKLDANFGLIGMDMMSQWKSVTFSSTGGLKIQIEI